jgi:hypothetical protein
MQKNLIATLLIAVSAAVAAPAFASGYGPAPSYRPNVGAPVSQRGQSAQTIAAEEATYSTDGRAFGGSTASLSQSGARAQGGNTNTAGQ